MMSRGIRAAAWLMTVLLLLSGCAGRGYMGGLGGILPHDYRQGEIDAQVKGEWCRHASDGYEPPSLSPMEGMGVGATHLPFAFTARIWAGAPIEDSGLRPFSLTYTSPETLAGVRVSCDVVRGEDGTWTGAYVLSAAGISLKVEPAEIWGLLRPLLGLLPVGDVTSAGREGGLSRVTVRSVSGYESVLLFDPSSGTYPIAVEFRDGGSDLHMRVTPLSPDA